MKPVLNWLTANRDRVVFVVCLLCAMVAVQISDNEAAGPNFVAEAR